MQIAAHNICIESCCFALYNIMQLTQDTGTNFPSALYLYLVMHEKG